MECRLIDIQIMIRHYKQIFKNPKDILEWIEHDLKHMGLEQVEIDGQLIEAHTILGKE